MSIAHINVSRQLRPVPILTDCSRSGAQGRLKMGCGGSAARERALQLELANAKQLISTARGRELQLQLSQATNVATWQCRRNLYDKRHPL